MGCGPSSSYQSSGDGNGNSSRHSGGKRYSYPQQYAQYAAQYGQAAAQQQYAQAMQAAQQQAQGAQGASPKGKRGGGPRTGGFGRRQ